MSVKIYERFTDEIVINDMKCNIYGVHRDWNPLPGVIPPEGTIWELVGQRGTKKIAVWGSSKENAIDNFRIAFHMLLEQDIDYF
jgi:hypothetical protein